MLDTLQLTNFTAFKDIEIDFSPKVNVIIGENSTGKTHLLKAAYFLSLCRSSFVDKDLKTKGMSPDQFSSTDFSTSLGKFAFANLRRLFLAPNARLAGLEHNKKEQVKLCLQVSSGLNLKCYWENTGTGFRGYNSNLVEKNRVAYPVFIPAKEMMSFAQGLFALGTDNDVVKRIFDASYIDNIEALMTPYDEQRRIKELSNHPRYGVVLPKLVKEIGGLFRFQEGKFEYRPGTVDEGLYASQHPLGEQRKALFIGTKEKELPATMTAEGFRKIGLLQLLLLNETLKPGESGPLLWDEPEANMNPRLMKVLVESLLELSRSGQQLVLTTHDYVLLKWFHLLSDSGKDDHIRYHVLYRSAESDEVGIKSFDEYSQLAPNSISNAYGELTDYEIVNTMGGLGR